MSLVTESTDRAAETSTPIHEVIAERWSPRSFDPAAPLDEAKLAAALEAARWAPSAANSQPARFIVARRGSAAFETIMAHLMGFNTKWAGAAGALVIGLAEVRDPEGAERRWAEYDLGQAMAQFTIQAHHDGLHVHQMGGFDAEGLRGSFDLDARLQPVTVAAVGTLASPDALPEPLRQRETAPRTRLPLSELVLVSE